MTVPTLEQNWYSRGRVPYPSGNNVVLDAEVLQQKSYLWLLKALLKGEVTTGLTASVINYTRGTVVRPTSSYWTCMGSSDSVSANLTGTDLWGSTFNAAKIVSNPVADSNLSWIVLKSPEALGPVYLNIYCRGTTSNSGSVDAYAGFVFSYSPFVTASATVRPGAGNAVGYGWGGDREWAPNNTGGGNVDADAQLPFSNVLRVSTTWHAEFTVNEDGGFHFATHRLGDGACDSYFWCDKAVEIDVTDVHPVWVGLAPSSAPAYLYNTSNRGAPGWNSAAGAGKFWSRSFDGYRSMSAGGGSLWSFGSGGNQFAGTAKADHSITLFNLMPIYLYDAVIGQSAWRGRFPDVWIVGDAPVFASYPSVLSATQHIIGDFIAPFAVPPLP